MLRAARALRRRFGASLAATALTAAGCAGPPPHPPQRSDLVPTASAGHARVAPPVAVTPFGLSGQHASARIQLKRFQLALDIPDPDGWRPVKGKGRFVELGHEATSSRLLIAVFSETELMSRTRCEEHARRYRELPSRVAKLASNRALVPAGFDTVVDAHFAEPEPARAEGQLFAFGANGRDCFAFVFTTSERAGDAARKVEERLVWIEGRTLGSMTRDRKIAIDPRETMPIDPREPPPEPR